MNITLTREEAADVLYALAEAAGCVQQNYQPGHLGHGWNKEIETLRARLAQPEPEPVAWMYEYGTDHGDAVNQIFWHKNLRLEKPDGMVRNVVPLYTAPPQRKDIYEEGCTPTDFRVLREANARMAQELFELRSKK